MAVLPDGPGVQDAEDMEGLPRARPEPRRSALFVDQQFATIQRVLLTHLRIDANLPGPRGSLLGGVQISTDRQASFCWPIN